MKNQINTQFSNLKPGDTLVYDGNNKWKNAKQQEIVETCINSATDNDEILAQYKEELSNYFSSIIHELIDKSFDELKKYVDEQIEKLRELVHTLIKENTSYVVAQINDSIKSIIDTNNGNIDRQEQLNSEIIQKLRQISDKCDIYDADKLAQNEQYNKVWNLLMEIQQIQMQNTCALKQDSNLQETTSLTENCPIFTRMKKNVIYNNADSSYYTCMSIELDQNESDINAYIIESNIAWSCNEDKLIDISLFVNGNNVTKIYK